MATSVNLKDPILSTTARGNCHLSIQITEQHATVCVSDVKTNTNIALWQGSSKKNLLYSELALLNLLNECDFPLGKGYAKTSVSIKNSKISFVPQVLFDENQLPTYVELNAGTCEIYDFHFDSLEQRSLKVVYAVPKTVIIALNQALSNFQLLHHFTVLLTGITSDFKPNNDELYIHYSSRTLEILYLKNHRFYCGNQYKIEVPEDFLYYLLNTCEQLSIAPQKLKLILLGEIKTGDEIHHLAFSYFKQIQFGVIDNKTPIASALNEVPKHIFYTAYKQHLCV